MMTTLRTIIAILAVGAAGVANAQNAGVFTPTGSMAYSRHSHTETLLPDGTVLITGGCGTLSGAPGCDSLRSAERYDPETETFSPTGDMVNTRYGHTATLLDNGTVLIAGGFGTDWASAEIYDPSTGTFTPTGSMVVGRLVGQPPLQSTIVGRFSHTATRLADGRVLLAGGLPGPALDAEIYDPATGAFTAVGGNCVPMPDASFECGMVGRRSSHTATLLDNGTVLIVGGQDSTDPATGEIFDPAAGRFNRLVDMAASRRGHTATRLQNGKVLVVGGEALGLAEIYDAVAGTIGSVFQTGPIYLHTATLLPSGHVLLAGGISSLETGTPYFYSAAVEVDAVSSTIEPVSTWMAQPRYAHTATMLNNDRILMAGGLSQSVPFGWTAELFVVSPRANDGTLAAVEDEVAYGTLTASASPGTPLTFSILGAHHGSATLTDASTGAFTFTPFPNAYGPDYIFFKVSNGLAESNIATIVVNIAPVNDAPVAIDSGYSMPADSTLVRQVYASDGDGPGLTYSVASNGTKGTATFTNPATGEFTYVPAANATGVDTFTFKVSDGFLDSNIATVTITITPVVASVSITANGSEGPVIVPHGGPLQIAIAGHTATGSATISPADLYIGLQTPFGLYWLNSSFGFVTTPSRLVSAPLPTFGPVTLFNVPNASVLPAGTYTWFIAVVNGGNVLFDSVQTTIQ